MSSGLTDFTTENFMKKTITDHFGYTIKELRTYFRFSRLQVFHGLGDEHSWKKYEIGENNPDFLLFFHLLGRLGISEERFDILLPDFLHDFFIWYKNCIHFAEKKDGDKLLKESDKFKTLTLINNPIQMQGKEYINYLIERSVKKDNKKALNHLLKAISYTINDIEEITEKNLLLSPFEWNLLCNYFDLSYEINPKDNAVLTQKMLSLYSALKIKPIDDLLKSEIVPRFALVLLIRGKETLTSAERLSIAEEILTLSTQYASIQKVPTILDILISEEPALYKQYAYKTWRNSLAYIFSLCEKTPLFRVELFYQNRNYLLFSEVIKARRKQLKLTIENACDEVCDPKTYGNAERGRTYPSKSTLKKIKKKLGLDFHYFRGEVETDKIHNIFLCSECRKSVATKNLDEVMKTLQELKMNLDLNLPLNRQTIEFFEFIINNRIEAQENINKLKTIFSYTGKEIHPQGIYTRNEIEILSLLFREIGEHNTEEGIKNLEQLLENEKEFHTLSFSRTATLKIHQIYILLRKEEYEKCYMMGTIFLKRMIKADETSLMLNVLDYLSTIEEEKGSIEKAKELCKHLFYAAELYGRYLDANMIKSYYQKIFNDKEAWYFLDL